VDLQENIPLAPYTTLRIGGPARYFARITTENELLEAIHFARANHLPIFTLGGGSNLLVSDEGFPGLVLHLAIDRPAITINGLMDAVPANRIVTYDIPAGFDWNAFVLMACEARFTGVECLAGIPGTVGASPIQNVTEVRVLNLDRLEFWRLSPAACGFAYRRSIFNSTHRGQFIVTRVSFSFSIDDSTPDLTYADLAPLRATNPTPLDVYHYVRQIRDRKGMLIDPPEPGRAPTPDSRSAGSFFKNPIVPLTALARIAAELSIPESEIPRWPTPTGDFKLPAAWLIERAGFPKGFSLGPVGISSRHTLALINRTGAATCADLLALRDLIATTIAARFAITLEQEPVFLSGNTKL
jgi:UDP-N-acetylmuramate dehydrogenase